MALTDEQIKELKKQLSEQVTHLPPSRKEEAQRQIDSMSPEALELLVEQQKQKAQSQKIFRLIASGEIPSVKLGENAETIAILDIKPISKGHAVIVPKSPAKDEKSLPPEAKSLAEQISLKLKENLGAKSVEIIPEVKFGEAIVNVIPFYSGAPLTLNSPRSEASPKELEEIAKSINVIKVKKEKAEVVELKKKSPRSRPQKLERRIP